jgi:Matrixin
VKHFAAFATTLLMGLSLSRASLAFCRTHACNPADPAEQCERDADNCIITGDVLYWPSSCVGFSVQENGSAKYGIDAQTFGSMVQTALDRWTSAVCVTTDATQDSVPSLHVKNLGAVSCGQVEFNLAGANANIWMFRDDSWPYVGGADALGLSTLHYDPDTGVIQDVDVEINAAGQPLSVTGAANAADLDSILTHEAGHFLGLSHTNVAGATMAPGYTLGDQSQRSLEPDDTAGICAAYPSGRVVVSVNSSNPKDFDDCTPRRGLAQMCGGALPETNGDPNPSDSTTGCSIGARGVGIALDFSPPASRLTAPRRSPTVGPTLGTGSGSRRTSHDAFLVCGLVLVTVSRRLRLFRKRVASTAR